MSGRPVVGPVPPALPLEYAVHQACRGGGQPSLSAGVTFSRTGAQRGVDARQDGAGIQSPEGWVMQTLLRYPPLADYAARFAADTVVLVRGRIGVQLDYSPGSLRLVDRSIEGLRREGRPVAELAETLVGFGAYVGEVMVRQAGARWVDFNPHERALFGHAFGVRTPDGQVWNPLGKAFKRYTNGPDHSLYTFYKGVAGSDI